jgi:CDP-paratose 2-epimerase
MFWHFYQNPKSGEVYNAGGGRFANCSMLEAMKVCEEITGKRMNYSYSDQNRIGDHIWWISDMKKFRSHYPQWHWKYDLKNTLIQVHDGIAKRATMNER